MASCGGASGPAPVKRATSAPSASRTGSSSMRPISAPTPSAAACCCPGMPTSHRERSSARQGTERAEVGCVMEAATPLPRTGARTSDQ